MLSFLSTVTDTGNGTPSTGETGTQGQDEAVKPSCNGGGGKRKRKGGKQSVQSAAAKLTKVAVEPPAAMPTAVEPAATNVTESQAEEPTLVDIPNLDSPLFKDVPSSNKNDSSSSSSSSSGASSSSDDSSSDNESDAGEVKRPEPARTPIKLTISNPGKPSAKVTAMAAPHHHNNRQPALDGSIVEEEKQQPTLLSRPEDNVTQQLSHPEAIVETKTEEECEEDPEEALRQALAEVEENNRRDLEESGDFNKPAVSETFLAQTGLCTKVVNKAEEESSPDPLEEEQLVQDALRVALSSPGAPDETSISVTQPDRKLKTAGTVSVDLNIKPEGCLQVGGLLNTAPGVCYNTSGINHEKNAIGSTDKLAQNCHETQKGPISDSHNDFSTEFSLPKSSISISLDEKSGILSPTSKSDIGDNKYCPDGFILSPTLSKSPEHLKSTVKSLPITPSLEVYSNNKTNHGFSLAALDSKNTLNASSMNNTIECKEAQHTMQDTKQDNMDNFNTKTRTENQNETQCTKNQEALIKDQNLNIKISNGNDQQSSIKSSANELGYVSEQPAPNSSPKSSSTSRFLLDKPSASTLTTALSHSSQTSDQSSTLKANPTITSIANSVSLPSSSTGSALEATVSCTSSNPTSTSVTPKSIFPASEIPCDIDKVSSASINLNTNPSIHSTTSMSTNIVSSLTSTEATFGLPMLSSSEGSKLLGKQQSKPCEISPAESVKTDAGILSVSAGGGNNSRDTISSNLTPTTTSSVAARTTTTTTSLVTVALTLSSAATSVSKTITSLATGPKSTTTTTTNSNKVNKKCTNGIPDCDNPFITWTKYDDDKSGFVQPLSFPSLALPSDVPLPQISPVGGAGLSQISPLGGSVMPQMSPLLMASAQRLQASPGHSQHGSQVASQANDRSSKSSEGAKGKGPPKSMKRTSRLSNIIDNLRTNKEKEVSTQPASTTRGINSDVQRKTALDVLFGSEKKSSGLPQVPLPPGKKVQSSSGTVWPQVSHSPNRSGGGTSSSDHRQASERGSLKGNNAGVGKDRLYQDNPISAEMYRLYKESQADKDVHRRDSRDGYVNADARQAIRSNLEAARAQAVNNSFSALREDLDKGKRMLEGLAATKNGFVDPYRLHGSQSASAAAGKGESSHPRIKTPTLPSSLLSSSASSITTQPSTSSSSRPSSRQSSKVNSHPASSPSLHPASSNASSTATTTTNSSMFQSAPSAALAAAHMELNAAANLLAFPYLYGMPGMPGVPGMPAIPGLPGLPGMPDPSFMAGSPLASPMYLQRLMDYQKMALDPAMLRQLEMFEAAAASAEMSGKSASGKDRDRDPRSSANAQSMMWQAQAASLIQQQQMQQLFHQHQQQQQQQQLHHQAAAVREREARDTIAAIMAGQQASAGKGHPSGSISTGQSAKSALAAAAASASLSQQSLHQSSASKRPRQPMPPSPADTPTQEKRSRPGQGQVSSGCRSSPQSMSATSSTSAGQQSKQQPISSTHPSLSAGNSGKSRSSSISASPANIHQHMLAQHQLDLPAALQLSAAAGWGFPPGSLALSSMARFLEPQAAAAASQSLNSSGNSGREPSGAEVLDLSVKPSGSKSK